MPSVEFYVLSTMEKDGTSKLEHRWRIKAANGNIVAASTQGYSRRIDAVENLAQIAAAILQWSKDNA